jgi:hypothetical protein
MTAPWCAKEESAAKVSSAENRIRPGRVSDDVQGDYVNEGIDHAFGFMKRRAAVVAHLIERHQTEFGGPESSIDAICLSMVSLAALAKFRYQQEVGPGNYRAQFRKLLRNYGGDLFSDRLSIPELVQHGPYDGITQTAIDALTRSFPLAGQSMNHALDRDPTVAAAMTELASKAILLSSSDLERFEYSTIIYRKYRNPVIHALNIADDDEPRNMWFGRPGLFYANKLRTNPNRETVAVRLLGVTDEYLLDLLREITQNLRSWCLNERRNIFVG